MNTDTFRSMEGGRGVSGGLVWGFRVDTVLLHGRVEGGEGRGKVKREVRGGIKRMEEDEKNRENEEGRREESV